MRAQSSKLGHHVVTESSVQRRLAAILAHLRFLLEDIRPEMRQYFFEADKDGSPFPRDKRAIVYQRAKQELDSRAMVLLSPGHLIQNLT